MRNIQCRVVFRGGVRRDCGRWLRRLGGCLFNGLWLFSTLDTLSENHRIAGCLEWVG